MLFMWYDVWCLFWRVGQAEAERQRVLEAERTNAALNERLSRIGKCPAGFVWNSDGTGGYICGGGSHTVSAGQLNNSR